MAAVSSEIYPSRIWRLVVVACCILGAVALALAWTVERTREANNLVNHTQEVTRVLGIYTAEFLDAETGQRGYLLTHQDIYLTPYQRALADNKGHLALLNELLANDPVRPTLQRLAELFDQKLEELSVTIQLAQAGDTKGALGIVLEGRGRRYTSEFQSLAQQIDDFETNLLVSGRARAESARRRSEGVAIVGSILACIPIGIIFVLVFRAMRSAKNQNYVFQGLVKSMDEGFCLVEMIYDQNEQPIDYRFLEVNPAFETQTGLRQAQGKTICQMVPDHEQHWFEIYGKVARTGEEIRFENPAVAMQRHYDVFAFRVGGDGSKKVGILFNDITKRKEIEKDLINTARYDSLTGLPNRLMFLDYFGKALSRAARNKYQLALLFLDLDGFKAVNDTLGHQAGDNLLQLVSQRLLSCVRAGDLVSRLGGDEFTIVLENCPQVFLTHLADKIIQVLELPFNLDGKSAHISTSIGIAVYPDSATDKETLVQRADAAMYAVKKDGKGGYRFWSAPIQQVIL